MLFQVSSSLFAQAVDLSRHEVHAFGIWHLSVMAGLTNLKVCELTKAPGTASVARIGCPYFRPYGRGSSGMLPFGCLNQLPQDGAGTTAIYSWQSPGMSSATTQGSGLWCWGVVSGLRAVGAESKSRLGRWAARLADPGIALELRRILLTMTGRGQPDTGVRFNQMGDARSSRQVGFTGSPIGHV